MEENEKEDASVSAKLDRMIELLERLRAKIETESFRAAALWGEGKTADSELCSRLLVLMDRIEKEAKEDE